MDRTPVLAKAVWLQRFGRRLMQMRPDMTAVTAARLSLQTYREDFDVMPERSAERLARDQAERLARDQADAVAPSEAFQGAAGGK